MSTAARYTPAEELANSLIHGFGTIAAIVALAVLVGWSSATGTALHIVGVSIFGAPLILMYAASTLYHSVTHPRAKEILRAFDHSAIFLLIAGTYTPFCLVNLQGVWGWSIFAAIWTLAVTGVLLRVFVGRKSNKASVALYIAMGWLIVIAFKPLLASISAKGMIFLMLGGVSYTGGVVFYVWRSLPFHHAIWHVFVLGGSVFHFFAILFGTVP